MREFEISAVQYNVDNVVLWLVTFTMHCRLQCKL